MPMQTWHINSPLKGLRGTPMADCFFQNTDYDVPHNFWKE